MTSGNGLSKSGRGETMKRHICEFEIFESEGMWCALPIGLDGGTCADTRQGAIEAAVEWLEVLAEDAAIWGKELPLPVFGSPLEHCGERVVVTIHAGRELVDAVTASQAAKMLGVSRPRVSQMLKGKSLEGWRGGRNTYVTRASVIARLEDPKPAGGRPRK